MRRFSETRRPHPLSQGPEHHQAEDTGYTVPADLDHGIAADGHRALIDAIELERELLSELREASTVIDTSQLRPAQLRIWIRDLMSASSNRLTLVFESFAFKHGVPLDADCVFDVRVLRCWRFRRWCSVWALVCSDSSAVSPDTRWALRFGRWERSRTCRPQTLW